MSRKTTSGFNWSIFSLASFAFAHSAITSISLWLASKLFNSLRAKRSSSTIIAFIYFTFNFYVLFLMGFEYSFQLIFEWNVLLFLFPLSCRTSIANVAGNFEILNRLWSVRYSIVRYL